MVYSKKCKHLIAVDCVIFGYEDGELKVLLYPRGFEPHKGKWSLLGGFLKENETLENSARRVLFQTTGLTDIYLEQVHSFSELNRDPGGRVLSVAYFALVKIRQQDHKALESNGAKWWTLSKIPKTVFDHEKMIKKSLEKLQIKASSELIGKELLGDMLTIKQLRNLYEAIFQQKMDPGNFRKKVLSLNVLERLLIKEVSESKKGAYYYRFKKSKSMPLASIVKPKI